MSESTTGGLIEDRRWHGLIFTGSWTEARGGTRDVMEPATGQRLWTVGIADAEDIDTAAGRAYQSQLQWMATAPRDRADVFHRAAALMQSNCDELVMNIVRETGSIVPKAQHEVREAVLLLQLAAGRILEPHGEVLPSVAGRLSYAKRVPLGVIGVISPFNFPLILSIRAVAPALALGNAVILKPDPQTPVSGGYIIARVLEEAGLPPGVLQVLPGGAEAGEALCCHPHVRMISFTGSTAVGRRIGELAGKHLKKLSLELGGNNSLIVLDDADLELAASNAAWGAYMHQGQICMASNRIIAHQSIAAELTRRLVEKAAHLPVGDPRVGAAIGPLINDRQVQRVHSIVSDSVAAGARLETGGTYDRLFYQPTVLSRVTRSMRVFTEEVFGPVASVLTCATDEEAIALANDTPGSLAAGVISRSIGRAMGIGERLQSGMVHINDQTVNDDCVNPFGGPGAAGNGTSVGGSSDWEEYTQWRWVTIKDTAPRYPF